MNVIQFAVRLSIRLLYVSKEKKHLVADCGCWSEGRREPFASVNGLLHLPQETSKSRPYYTEYCIPGFGLHTVCGGLQ